jgi:dTDP-4-amino-4,6-dideoxygalactose transaminase
MAANTDLAVFGREKTVTLAGPAWPYFSDEEIEAVRQGLLRSRTDWTEACTAAVGGDAEKLEKRFAESLGRRYAIATCGGGPSLHIACMAAGVGLGDEVITTPYSWGQTVSCILQAGGIPVFADIHPDTLTLDPARIEPLISRRTKAIVLVDIFGVPADMDAVMAIAKRRKLIVIEDCAQAHGSRYKGTPVGTRGHFGCFSIGSGKNLAAGDGGMLACDDQRLYEMALLAGMHPARTHKQIASEDLKARIDSLIYTYRINAFTAALALKQMDRFDEMNGWRRRNAQRLKEAIAGMPGIRPLPLSADFDPAWHMLPWTFAAEDVPGVSRAQYLKALGAEGVPIWGSYVGTPIPLRRMFQKKEWWLGRGYPWAATARGRKMAYRAGDWPVAERRCAEQDMMLGGGGWWKDVSPLIDQIAAAFRKVAAQVHRLRDVQA